MMLVCHVSSLIFKVRTVVAASVNLGYTLPTLGRPSNGNGDLSIPEQTNIIATSSRCTHYPTFVIINAMYCVMCLDPKERTVRNDLRAV
jgi:hypothetical protein